MKAFLRTIRDGIQRTLFNQERAVLAVMAKDGRWMTYVEISFASKGRVSTDNALTVLYELRDPADENEQPRVDFTIRRDGEVGSYWRINDAGLRRLEKR